MLENRNSVKISDMPNEIRSVSIGAFDMIADFWDLGECYCWKTFFWLIPFIPLFCYSWKIKIPELLWNSGIYIVLLSLKVVPPGIEPGTQGFSVLCSTNWAMAPCLIAVAKVVKLLESARLPVIKNTDKKLVCLLSVLYELKIFLLLTGIFYLSSFSGFQPWAFSSNSCPSRVIKAQPSSGLVICPMRRIPSICETFSWSAIGTVKRSS